jgi:hypothetical protein
MKSKHLPPTIGFIEIEHKGYIYHIGNDVPIDNEDVQSLPYDVLVELRRCRMQATAFARAMAPHIDRIH